MMNDERRSTALGNSCSSFIVHHSSLGTTMDRDAVTNSGNLSLGEGDSALASLEQRVQRLEDAVTALQEGAEKPQVKVGPLPAESDKIMAGKIPDTSVSNPLLPPRPPWLI